MVSARRSACVHCSPGDSGTPARYASVCPFCGHATCQQCHIDHLVDQYCGPSCPTCRFCCAIESEVARKHGLTPKHLRVWVYLDHYFTRYLCSPSSREMVAFLGVSLGVVQGNLAALIRKGAIVPCVGANGVVRGWLTIKRVNAAAMNWPDGSIYPFGPVNHKSHTEETNG